jgi:hypothetical protein
MENSLKKYFTWILSFIFVAAGVLKMFNPDNTGDILVFLFEIEHSTASAIVYSVALIEIFLGLSLALKFKELFTKKLVVLSCSLFLIISLIGYLDNWQVTCGCFGRFSFGKFDSAMLFRNSLLLSMAMWITIDLTKYKNLIQTGSLTNNNK